MNRDCIVVLDFGGQEARLAARMIRNANVFSVVLPYNASIEDIKAASPKGIIAIGGTQDAELEGSPEFNKDIFALCLPVLAMGYGSRAMALACGGRLGGKSFDGDLKKMQLPENELFEGVSGMRRFSRADRMSVPKGFGVLCAIEGIVIAMTSDEYRATAVQFTPEANDIESQRLLSNFAINICKCQPDWSVEAFLQEATERIRALVGSASAIVSVTGGLDSAVCAALMHRAIGSRLKCVMIDSGLLRSGETDFIAGIFRDHVGIELEIVDSGERFLRRLTGVKPSSAKRRIVREEMDSIIIEKADETARCEFLAKGTIITDRRFSSSEREGLPGFESRFASIIEPLDCLFKDEVRSLGAMFGLPEAMLWQQPFPGQGMALRCLGDVTPEKLAVLRRADEIFRGELAESGHSKQLRQFFAVLSDKPGGDYTDERMYMVVLRAAQTGDSGRAACARLPYDLLERVADTITREMPRVARVTYDLTPCPPAAVEWE